MLLQCRVDSCESDRLAGNLCFLKVGSSRALRYCDAVCVGLLCYWVACLLSQDKKPSEHLFHVHPCVQQFRLRAQIEAGDVGSDPLPKTLGHSVAILGGHDGLFKSNHDRSALLDVEARSMRIKGSDRRPHVDFTLSDDVFSIELRSGTGGTGGANGQTLSDSPSLRDGRNGDQRLSAETLQSQASDTRPMTSQ